MVDFDLIVEAQQESGGLGSGLSEVAQTISPCMVPSEEAFSSSSSFS